MKITTDKFIGFCERVKYGEESNPFPSAHLRTYSVGEPDQLLANKDKVDRSDRLAELNFHRI